VTAPAEEIDPIRWEADHLVILDQTLLPERQTWISIHTVDEAIAAIREMRVRGAPAIGVTAAYAMVLAARPLDGPTISTFLNNLEPVAARLAAARPTAVNLRWAVQRSVDVARTTSTTGEVHTKLLALAHQAKAEDIATNKAIGRHGAPLIPHSGGVLTHCNTGALATTGYGTALGVIRAAWELGKRPRVFCTETRPWLQGARLTAWELVQMGIPAKLVVDSAAGWLMARGDIQAIIVGADRIAANGDTANKIGTYGLAVLAASHEIPFYVVAPTSTVDLGISGAGDMVIEERGSDEVTTIKGIRVAAEGIGVYNPAFDITPARYITAILTENGVLRAPYERGLRLSSHASERAS